MAYPFNLPLGRLRQEGIYIFKSSLIYLASLDQLVLHSETMSKRKSREERQRERGRKRKKHTQH